MTASRQQMQDMPKISSTDVTLAQLRALVAVIDTGGFTSAASQLGLTQSGISQAVASLERALGVRLLARPERRSSAAASPVGTAARPMPTEIGQHVLAEARAALAHVDVIRQHVASATGLETGTLRIASVPSVAATLLPGLMARFRRRHPGVRLVLLEGSDEEVVEWVHSRLADVGFAGADGLDIHGLTVVPAAEDELLLVLPRTHRLARTGRVPLTALQKEPVLLSAGGCEPLIRGAFARAVVEPNVVMSVRDLPTLLALVREKVGVTLVPALALPPRLAGLRGLGLRPAVRRSVVAVTSRGAEGSPVLQRFLREARIGHQ